MIILIATIIFTLIFLGVIVSYFFLSIFSDLSLNLLSLSVIYLSLINIFTLLITYIDKRNAEGSGERVREVLFLANFILGGAILAPFTLLLLSHKTSNEKYYIKGTAVFACFVWVIIFHLILKS